MIISTAFNYTYTNIPPFIDDLFPVSQKSIPPVLDPSIHEFSKSLDLSKARCRQLPERVVEWCTEGGRACLKSPPPQLNAPRHPFWAPRHGENKKRLQQRFDCKDQQLLVDIYIYIYICFLSIQTCHIISFTQQQIKLDQEIGVLLIVRGTPVYDS